MDEQPGAPLRARTRRRRRVSFVGVLGEVLITVGIVVLLYVAWQLWIGDLIYGAERTAQAQALSETWQEDFEAQHPSPTASGTPAPAPIPTDVTTDPVILPEAADAQVFGTMHIPRFGPDYAVAIAGGVTRARTLDPIGIGHYPGTPMPGAVGNVAFAAHRTTWGKPFNRIADLHVGDAIVIETPDGWYTYRFRTLEYVKPTAVEVLLPVPQATGVAADDRYLTMTSCSPMYSLAERIVAYSVFESFTPRSAGAPASLTTGAA
ncbi:class E sortase [Microbacterium sp. B2969]|uniref:Class E sortase n=1 Tax=Microbacterium alkaliflavum TaxID=3248839 RepID=A0ABW7QA69_9MICO